MRPQLKERIQRYRLSERSIYESQNIIMQLTELASRLRTIDSEEVMIPPEDPIRVTESDSVHDRRAVHEATGASSSLHVQSTLLHHQQTMLWLYTQTRQLYVGRTVRPDQSTILDNEIYYSRVRVAYAIVDRRRASGVASS